MRLLVTGGAGYIGQATCARLLDRGHEVTVVDNEMGSDLGALPESIRRFRGDCGDPDTIARAIAEPRRVDGVLHLAAIADVALCEKRPDAAQTQNVELVRVVAEECRKRGVDSLVFASTCMVYGEGPGVPIAEETDRAPRGVYARSKSDAEDIVVEASKRLGLKSSILRYFYVSGVDSSPQAKLRGNFVSESIRRGLSGETLPVFSSSTFPEGPTRDYVDVKDVARANVAALERPPTEEEVRTLNVGTGVSSSLADVINEANRTLGRELKTDPAAPPPTLGRYLVANPSKIKSELGWSAEVALPEMMAALKNYFVSKQESAK
jgi:UDP-glucose 4-epimerase